jgi:hypothetical protein
VTDKPVTGTSARGVPGPVQAAGPRLYAESIRGRIDTGRGWQHPGTGLGGSSSGRPTRGRGIIPEGSSNFSPPCPEIRPGNWKPPRKLPCSASRIAVLEAVSETETAAEPAWSGSPWPRCSPQRRPGRPGEPPGSPAGWKPGTSSGLYRIEITGTGNDGKPPPPHDYTHVPSLSVLRRSVR